MLGDTPHRIGTPPTRARTRATESAWTLGGLSIAELGPGSAFAVVEWAVMSVALRFYAGHFANNNRTYGSIAGVSLLMLWLYLSGVALLVGAAIDSKIASEAPAH